MPVGLLAAPWMSSLGVALRVTTKEGLGEGQADLLWSEKCFNQNAFL